MGILKHFTDDTRRFLCRSLCYISMVGRAGASKDAPVSVRPVMPTPSGSTTSEIGISSGGFICYSLEAALWLQPSTRLTSYSLFLSVPPPISPC
ncbi:TPA: ash family protein [Citrobacter freundii]|nr:ash family protein [Citrobacter freundii]